MDTYRDTVWWPTGNGEPARFYVYEAGATWYDVAGVVIFARLNGRSWEPLFVGSAESFTRDLPEHPQWLEAVLLGATHVHAASIDSAAQRDDLVHRLIAHHRPLLNG